MGRRYYTGNTTVCTKTVCHIRRSQRNDVLCVLSLFNTFVRSFVRLFICHSPDRSCYDDISWTDWAVSMNLTLNIH